MLETAHLHPPHHGPQSDPLLFGVASALEMMFPLAETERRTQPPVKADGDANSADEAELA